MIVNLNEAIKSINKQIQGIFFFSFSLFIFVIERNHFIYYIIKIMPLMNTQVKSGS